MEEAVQSGSVCERKGGDSKGVCACQKDQSRSAYGCEHENNKTVCSHGGDCATTAASCTDDHDEDACDCGHDHNGAMKAYEKISLVIAGVFVVLSLVAEHLLHSELLLIIAAGTAIIAGLIIVLPETFESLKSCSVDINVLIIVAIIGALYVKAYEEAAAVLFLFSVGEYLESRALRKSNDAIKDLAKLAPDTALVIREGQTMEVATDRVAKGETIVVKPGMSVALDGIIVRGSSSFNDAAITGESIPVYKSRGDLVFAASLAVDGSCEIETTSTVADSTLAKIANMVKEAQKQKSSREYFVQNFAKVYTPLVVGIAILIALVPSMLTVLGLASLGTPDTWIYRACELLVISCPCAFVISTPVTLVSALARAAKMGVLVKGGAFFEEGSHIRVAAFDKTGTLTEGRPVVTAVLPKQEITGSFSTFYKTSSALADSAQSVLCAESLDIKRENVLGQELVAIAAALEQHSTHPLSLAVLDYAEKQGINSFIRAEEVKETAGKGIVGTIAGISYAIGSPVFIEQECAFGDAIEALLVCVSDQVGTLLFVARLGDDPCLLGVIVVADAIRSEARSVISALHALKLGMRTVMLTGDNARVASSMAAAVGIDEVYATLLPQDKIAEIRRIQQSGEPVAYVGDGINDAPSLAAADVGVALAGAGSSVALSSADVVLMADDLATLPKFFMLSAKTVYILKQNVVLAIGLKVLVALLVVLGIAQMWLAVLADTGVSLLVILNGMRLLHIRL